MTYIYEVALSFAGEDRAFAEAVAHGLREAGVEVFYDLDYSTELWGEDLSVKLREAYYAESRYCIMILSPHYLEKMWPNFERQQAIERLIQEKGRGYILPVRLDGFDGDVPGLSKLIGYLSVTSNNPELVLKEFLKKIGKRDEPASTDLPKTPKPFVPKLKKPFTDKEKNKFLRESFEDIVKSLEYFASETHREYPHFEFELERVTSRKVIFTLYDSGSEIARFKVWISGMMGGDSIYFLQGSTTDLETDTSYNECISVEEYEGKLRLKFLGMLMFGVDRDKAMFPREVATQLWSIVCRTFT